MNPEKNLMMFTIPPLIFSSVLSVKSIVNETSAKVKIHADDVIPILFMDNMGITYFFKDCSRHRN